MLTGATSSAEVNVSVTGTVALGVDTATITATADGVNQAAATVQDTVTSPPDFVLTVNPSALTVVLEQAAIPTSPSRAPTSAAR